MAAERKHSHTRVPSVLVSRTSAPSPQPKIHTSLRQRSDFPELFNELLSVKMVSETDRQPFYENFPNTGRGNVNVRPGLEFYFEWSKPEVLKLDDAKGRFEEDVRDRIVEALSAWQQSYSFLATGSAAPALTQASGSPSSQ